MTDFILCVGLITFMITASIITDQIYKITNEFRQLNEILKESNRILTLIQSSAWRKL